MTRGLLLKAAALVVFLGVLGGATYGVQTFLGGDAASAVAMQVEAPRASLNATAGHAVTFPIVLHNRGDEAVRSLVRATGEGVQGTTAAVVVPARGNATVFLTVDVPATAAPGALPVTVAALDASGTVLRERADLLTVRVLGPGVGFQEGDTAAVRYTGRLASTGKVFDTNDPVLLPLAFPRLDSFQPHGTAPLTVEHANPMVIDGFFEGLLGMQAGESRTVTFPAEKGYGPKLVPRELDRHEPLERAYALELTTDEVQRAVFDDYVRETGQGSDFAAGDVFRFEQGPNRWPYLIIAIDDATVQYRLAVQPGENYTLYPFWENASQVVEVDETHAHFLTTPTTAVGEAFTMMAYWPDMSEVTEITDDEIVVRHSPPVGFKFSQGAPQGQPAQEAIVQEVRDDVVVVGVQSDNPLAGEALTFDVEMLSLTR